MVAVKVCKGARFWIVEGTPKEFVVSLDVREKEKYE